MSRVLVVDDEENQVRVLAIGLRLEGFEVLTARSADTAFDVLPPEPLDIAILALMHVETFSYDLPPERIAQHPTEDREAARLMVLPDDGGAAPVHTSIGELASLIPEQALVILNDTRVIRARLLGKKPETGGKVE